MNVSVSAEGTHVLHNMTQENTVASKQIRERSEFMGDLKEKIMEELNCETVFTIHLGNFDIPIAESTVITWVIMVILLALCIFLTRGLKVKNVSKRQLVAESIVGWLEKFVIGMTGEEGKAFVPYLCSVLLYIGFANLIGLCGVKPPTKDLNVTAALAVMSIVLVQYAGIHKKGFKGWLKSFTQPMAIVTPINILELFIKPLSLCMRLFGNVLGAFVIMELLKSLIPVVLPVPFSFYFDIFDGLIQAYVFVFLTSLYIKEAVEE